MNTTGIPSYIILQALEASLTPLAATLSGSVVVAYDPAQALDLLKNAPNTFRIVLGVDDEVATEDLARIGLTNTSYFTMVQAPLGLPSDPSKVIHRGRPGGGPSIMELAENVRSWVRGLDLQHPSLNCEMGFNWRSSSWVATKEDGKPMVHARQHNFDLVHVIAPATPSEPMDINWPPA